MSLANSKILVTGGAGFIGSMMTRRLLEDGAEVTVLDSFFTGSRENLPQHAKLRIVEGCITDPRIVRDLVQNVDYVFHLAARNIIAAIADPLEDFRVNAGGTLNLLQTVREIGTSVKKVIYASSVSVYGNPQYLPLNEFDLVTCLSPYAASKLAGESYCRVYYELWDLPVVTMRYSNVYGVGQSTANPYTGVIAKFLHWGSMNRPLSIHGDGLQTRDFTYISDVIEANILAATSAKAEGEIFNVGTGVETSVGRLASLVGDLCGRQLNNTHVNERDIDNVRRRVMNIEKIRSRLRWVPMVTLAGGLRSTYEWLQQNEWRGGGDLQV